MPIRLVRAELLKLSTTKLTWALVAAGLALVVLGVVTVLAVAGGTLDVQNAGSTFRLTTTTDVRRLLGTAAGGNQLALVIGIVMVTSEYRHDTIALTFLGEPQRDRAMVAKVATAILVGLGFAVLSLVLALAIALPGLASLDAPVRDVDVARAVAGTLIVMPLWCVFGVGIGMMIPNQVAAIVTGLLGASIAGSVLFQVIPEVGRYLPSAAGQALTGDPSGHALSTVAGGLVLLAYVVLTVGPGFFLVARRDVG